MPKFRTTALSILTLFGLGIGSAEAQAVWGRLERAPNAVIGLASPQPRFIVTAERLYANDETGRDFPGSDEIYLVFGSPSLGQFGYSTVFGDFDTGETKSFAAGRWCLAPLFEPVRHQNGSLYGWQCQSAGIGGPFSFSLRLYESDSAWTPHACLPNDLPPGVACQDDLIGARTVSYSRGELLAAMPRVGDQVTESVRLGGYSFFWRVQRIADSGTPPVIY